MQKIRFIVLALAMFIVTSIAWAQSSMTDQQVLDYAKQGMAMGKSQATIAKELAAKGVDRAQAERVKKLYESQNTEQATEAEAVVVSADRSHTVNAQEIDEQINTAEEEAPMASTASDEVYGRSIFRNRNLTFAPSANIPTPKNYVLGPGDEVIVDIFGANQTTIRRVISPEGHINIDALGPVYLSGKTIEAANTYLKNRLSQIFGGLTTTDAETSDIQLTLGQIRSIQVSIIGDVTNPGTFTISSLSTVYHAMFQAGGVKDPGTIRNIKVVRNNKQVAAIDIYDFLFKGSRKGDIRLEEGDVILVEPYEKVVKASGFVKRPMCFELKGQETLKDLITYAGGFTRSAAQQSVSVIRQDGQDYKVFTVEAPNYASFVLQDGDEVEVQKVDSRFDNRISIRGSVFIPGVYELGSSLKTVRQLVEKAGGLQPEAFTQRAVINRQHSDLSLETVAVDLEGILNGTAPDVALANNDELYISSIYEIEDQGTLTIRGEVANPSIFPYSEKMSIKDLILKAGGLLRSASLVKIDVARRITDPESRIAPENISQYFTFTMTDGYSFDGADSFVLEPYDVVTVRRSPAFVDDKTVSIEGEVNFPGVYNMSKRVERVTDLINMAGGITDYAYVRGARITRQLSEEERLLAQTAIRALVNNGDSLVPKIRDTYFVSIDLEQALKNPGSEYDVVLRNSDKIEVPVYNNTVRIAGAVQMQTTITYKKGLNKRKLINAAGGYLKRAYKKKAFVIYMNGSVARMRHNTPIEPGCQVFIPIKDKKNGTANITSAMSIATSAASLGMMGVSIANLLK